LQGILFTGFLLIVSVSSLHGAGTGTATHIQNRIGPAGSPRNSNGFASAAGLMARHASKRDRQCHPGRHQGALTLESSTRTTELRNPQRSAGGPLAGCLCRHCLLCCRLWRWSGRVQVLDEKDFVSLFVVDEFVDGAGGEEEAITSGAHPLLVALHDVGRRIVG
jgi:hypothetical protein